MAMGGGEGGSQPKSMNTPTTRSVRIMRDAINVAPISACRCAGRGSDNRIMAVERHAPWFAAALLSSGRGKSPVARDLPHVFRTRVGGCSRSNVSAHAGRRTRPDAQPANGPRRRSSRSGRGQHSSPVSGGWEVFAHWRKALEKIAVLVVDDLLLAKSAP
jgi:hypothetical protein